MNFSDLFKKDIFKNKRALLLFGILILGVALLLFSSSGGKGESEAQTESLSEYKERLEAELADVCASVEGVGRCRVVVTFERGAENTYKGSSLTQSKPPRVMGVSVVCSGADSDAVRSKLIEMMTSLFDIGSNRVSVLKLNS